MKRRFPLLDFLLKQWLLTVSAVAFAILSLCTRHLPAYSSQEIEVVFILWLLFVTVKGLQCSGLVSKLSQTIDQGGLLPLKLVTTTFFLSMLVTNDVALIVIVPLTLAMNINGKDILVILEALAANAGSALTPFGNPQNLYIYWYYDLQPARFIITMVPFASIFLLILVLSSLAVKIGNSNRVPVEPVPLKRSAYPFGMLLVVVLLIVLHGLPVAAGIVVILVTLLLDRRAFCVDYSLLCSFLFFFGISENMKMIMASGIDHTDHVFLSSALVSQVMSNVPAALLFAKFTSNWEALLWGTNTGGFGSLFGSLANLIAYKLYLVHDETENHAMFTIKFLILGYGAFIVAVGLYFILHRVQ